MPEVALAFVCLTLPVAGAVAVWGWVAGKLWSSSTCKL